MPSKMVYPHGVEVMGYFGPRWNRRHVTIGALSQVDETTFTLNQRDFLGLSQRLKLEGDEIHMKVGNKPIIIKVSTSL